MLIKVINEPRQNPRNRRDLRRLIRYLFEPQGLEDSLDDRLLGPPELHHLVTHFCPWGTEILQSADDLTLQIEEYCKFSTIGRTLPDDWFAHIAFSFAPWSSGNLASPPDDFKSPMRFASQGKNAVRVAKDAMDFLGWSAKSPALFVCHGDRAHIHVHAICPTVAPEGNDWRIYNNEEYPESLIFEAAKICADAFRLNLNTAKLKSYYKKWGEISASGKEI